MSRIPIRRALVSVADKDGLVDFCRRLIAAGVEIVASGGTSAVLSEAGLPVTLVSEVTRAPEMLGGRVKTLHPHIHGAILAKADDASHQEDLAQQGIEAFQLVVVNLYPFMETVSKPGIGEAEATEQIDIGGPAMVRAAAKNHAYVGVVTSPAQYEEVAAAVEAGGLPAEQRRKLARQAFFHTAAYDAAIVGWMEREEELPERLVVALQRHSLLRYGENPHQPGAAYFETNTTPWWAEARLLSGKPMSFNNWIDAEAAWRLVSELSAPAAAVVKHTNPCGVATGADIADSLAKAWASDPLAAFGGVVAINRPLDEKGAAALSRVFIEVLVAPEVEPDRLPTGKPNLRVLQASAPTGADLDLRRLEDGFVIQRRDRPSVEGWKVVSSAQPDPAQLDDLRLAWVTAAHTKSNSVVLVKGGATVGVGAGDQSRVGAAQRCLVVAGDRAPGSVAASDAFFPFRDGIDTLAARGVGAVVAPGGSRRDQEVIDAAEEAGLVLIFTEHRHFRH